MSSEVLENMNTLNNRNDASPSGNSPSDEELVEYLLGSVSRECTERIENWLTSDPSADDRLAAVSTILLSVDQALHAPWASCGTQVVAARNAMQSRMPGRHRVVFGFALTAAVALVAFAFSGIWHEDAETEVAMAWVESLPSSTGVDLQFPMNDPLVLDNWTGETDSSGMLGDFAESDDEDVATSEMDFLSDEPPDWLLAAVSDMHASDSLSELSESVP